MTIYQTVVEGCGVAPEIVQEVKTIQKKSLSWFDTVRGLYLANVVEEKEKAFFVLNNELVEVKLKRKSPVYADKSIFKTVDDWVGSLYVGGGSIVWQGFERYLRAWNPKIKPETEKKPRVKKEKSAFACFVETRTDEQILADMNEMESRSEALKARLRG